jgi:hypothetical protein
MRTEGAHWKSKQPGYSTIHNWISRNYGKATKCELPDCKGNCNVFHWALREGKVYVKKIENFMQMCASCHGRYDMTKETRERFSESAKVNSRFVKDNPMKYEEFRKKVSEKHKGRTTPEDVKRKLSDTQKGRTIPEKRKLRISQALKGAKNSSARKMICGESGKSFDTVKEAAEYVGIKYTTLINMLKGRTKNRTTLKYA